MRIPAVIIFILCIAFGQNISFAQTGGTSFLYENETSIGLMPHTKGFGASLQFTKHRTANNYRLLDFNLYTLKHPKEIKLPNAAQTASRAFVFGKINHLYVLKANYGARRILADKLAKNSVRINLNYSVGPLLGILKPAYYDVKIFKTTPTGIEPVIQQEKFSEENTSMQENTIGNAYFAKGLGESTFLIGANAKTSLSFEWGKEDNRFYSLEGGVMIDAFPKDVPIFAYIKNDKAFINLFLTLSYGTRR